MFRWVGGNREEHIKDTIVFFHVSGEDQKFRVPSRLNLEPSPGNEIVSS